MRLVLPFGFYGAGNTGDEATLNGFARLLDHDARRINVWSGSRNPAHTAKAEPAFRYFSTQRTDWRRWYAKYRATAYAVAGGTPIQDVLGDWPFSELAPHLRAAERRRAPFSFIGVGVEDLRYDHSRRLLAEEFAPRVRHWSVRSERGRERLVEYGVPAERISVAADMAWLIPPASREFGTGKFRQWNLPAGRRVIAINIANENSVFDRHPEMARALAAGLDALATSYDATLLFLAADVRDEPGFDLDAARKIIANLPHPDRAFLAPNDYFTPPQLMSIIGNCHLTFSMRYHFCLFSALQAVPFVGIQRTDKIYDLCWDLDWPARLVPPAFQAVEVEDWGRRLLQDSSALLAGLAQRLTLMRNRALLNLPAVHTLLAP